MFVKQPIHVQQKIAKGMINIIFLYIKKLEFDEEGSGKIDGMIKN